MNVTPYAPLPSPHAHAADSVPRVMSLVWTALLPASIFGVWQFGWPALNLIVITTLAAIVTEAVCLKVAGKTARMYVGDGSALLTAWLLALSLPPWAPWWIGALGGALAIVLGKQVFGGIGQNLFNPAMLARVVLLIAFPLELTTWIAPQPMLSPGSPDFVTGLRITFQGIGDLDAVSGASLLGHMRTELARGVPIDTTLASFDLSAAAIGNITGSIGETSALLIALGGLFLLARRLITWHIPVAVLGTVATLATITHGINPARFADAGVHLLSGGLLLGAFFIATDPVTSPSSSRGQLMFGALIGTLAWTIRSLGGYPEGVAFAVLIANAATPLIDHYLRPRIYGRTRKGVPISYPSERIGGKERAP